MFNILSNQSAKTIDALLSASTFLGLLFNLWGVIKIDWGITSEKFHVLFILSSIALSTTFLASLVIMHVRQKNTIFTSYNLSIKYLIYFFGFLNFIGLLLALICFFNVSNDLVEPISNQAKYDSELVFFIKQQWNIIFYSFSFTIIFYDLQFPLWYSSFKRLKSSNGSLRKGEFVIINN